MVVWSPLRRIQCSANHLRGAIGAHMVLRSICLSTTLRCIWSSTICVEGKHGVQTVSGVVYLGVILGVHTVLAHLSLGDHQGTYVQLLVVCLTSARCCYSFAGLVQSPSMLWTKSETRSDISGDWNYTRVKYGCHELILGCFHG